MTDKTIKLGRFKRSFERGHETGSGVFDTGCADAVYQCVFDGLQIAAPQPVIVVKVGIAERLASGGSRAMALRAVDLEGRTSSGYCPKSSLFSGRRSIGIRASSSRTVARA